MLCIQNECMLTRSLETPLTLDHDRRQRQLRHLIDTHNTQGVGNGFHFRVQSVKRTVGDSQHTRGKVRVGADDIAEIAEGHIGVLHGFMKFVVNNGGRTDPVTHHFI